MYVGYSIAGARLLDEIDEFARARGSLLTRA
jgi:hypothetical protein